MFFKKKTKFKKFEIPSAAECIKNNHAPKNLSVESYKNMFAETKVNELAQRLFNTMNKTYSRINIYTGCHRKEFKDAVYYWDKEDFPKEVLIAPWRDFLEKGWSVKIIIFHNDDAYNSIDVSIEVSAADKEKPEVSVINGFD